MKRLGHFLRAMIGRQIDVCRSDWIVWQYEHDTDEAAKERAREYTRRALPLFHRQPDDKA